jgi:hypothetical protein
MEYENDGSRVIGRTKNFSYTTDGRCPGRKIWDKKVGTVHWSGRNGKSSPGYDTAFGQMLGEAAGEPKNFTVLNYRRDIVRLWDDVPVARVTAGV